ncbi:MAG: xanthine dehydrogenase family protein subunit M, partial [Deltaproteobacteria bacterium]|nr:xanthine dehydrogenase family protein subunit M [Deltaproteobacteria bacterium]
MEYFEPKTIDEALTLLDKFGDKAKVIAGGTDVMVDMKFKDEPACLVNIKRISGLSEIQSNGAALRIGSLVTIRDLEVSPLVRERLALLWQASHQFASLQIRNTATIGGNICRASPSGETLAPLLVLEARAKLAFSSGEKTEGFDSFFQGPGKSSAGSAGLLTEIEVPYPAENSRSVYLKHAVRGPMDIAMVGVAVMVTPDPSNSRIDEARIGLGAVAPTPIRAGRTENMLRGQAVTSALLQEASQMSGSESSPITDQRSSAEYRRWI